MFYDCCSSSTASAGICSPNEVLSKFVTHASVAPRSLTAPWQSGATASPPPRLPRPPPSGPLAGPSHRPRRSSGWRPPRARRRTSPLRRPARQRSRSQNLAGLSPSCSFVFFDASVNAMHRERGDERTCIWRMVMQGMECVVAKEAMSSRRAIPPIPSPGFTCAAQQGANLQHHSPLDLCCKLQNSMNWCKEGYRGLGGRGVELTSSQMQPAGCSPHQIDRSTDAS